MRRRHIALLIALAGLLLVNASGVTITHYGAPDDASGDPLSAQGIGNHDNVLAPLQSAALTKSFAVEHNIVLGQSFSVTSTTGDQYNLIYADTVPDIYQGKSLGQRIDIFDPNSVLGPTNGFSKTAANIDNGPVLAGNGVVTDANGGTSFTHANLPPIVKTLLDKFHDVGKAWEAVIKRTASNLFWTLALISLVWTGLAMVLKHADFMEICAELVRYILFIGFFWWLLSNAPDFAGKIIASLWQIGGDASGTGNSIFPGDILALGLQVFKNTLTHINWLMPETLVVPVIIGLIIVIACVITAANVVTLLCAAWVLLYAGMIFLGFGGSRWTCDMAINYYRTILGIGVSLMTMLLIIGIGVRWLQDLVTAAGQTPDIPSLAALMTATILLAILAHKIPHMVANIALGSGHTGTVGTLGVLALLGAAGLVKNVAAAAAGGAAGAAGMSAADKLAERMSVLETANAAGNGNGAATASHASSPMASTVPSSTQQAPQVSPGAVRTPSAHPSSPSAKPATTAVAPENEPIPDRPISPDEQRGFQPPADWQYPDEPV